MIIGVPREIHHGERRVAIVPSTIGQLKKLGYEVIVEEGAGMLANFPDNLYKDAGAEVVKTAREIWKLSNLVLKIRGPERHPVLKKHEASLLRSNNCLICMLDPSRNKMVLKKLAESAKSGRKIEKREPSTVGKALRDFVAYGEQSSFLRRMTVKEIKNTKSIGRGKGVLNYTGSVCTTYSISYIKNVFSSL